VVKTTVEKLTPEQKTSIYQDYIHQAEDLYDTKVAEGETPSLSKEEYLESVKSDFPNALEDAVREQVSKQMEYQPGFKGYIGGASEFLSIPLEMMESWPTVPKALIGGMYQLVAPLTIATQLYPGPKEPNPRKGIEHS
jgi:hypothetical protein